MVIQRSVEVIKKNQIFIGFLVITAASLFLFYPSLNYYFFQDDWFVLNWVRTADWPSFFKFRTDIIYWRPLSMPLFFALNKLFFGLNPFGYHLVSFGIFFILVFCIYQLFTLLIGDRKIAIIAPLLYAVWPIHFMSLSWLCTTSYIIGPLLQVMSFIFFIKYAQRKKNIFLIISFVIFILALASSEFSLVLPLIMFGWGFLIQNKKYFKEIWPYFIIVVVYLIARWFVFPIPAKNQYQITINHLIIDNLIWYFGWALNFPESFKDLIDQRFPVQSVKILIQFWRISLPTIILIALFIKLTISLLKKNLRLLLMGLLWTIIGLLPVIALIGHSYSMYLSFAGLGVLYLISVAIKSANKIWMILFIILWFLSSWANLQFTRNTHWLVNEQAISRSYMGYVKKHIQNPSSESIFLFRPADLNFSRENNFILVETEDTLRQSLSDQEAIKVIYNEPTLKSIFATFKDNPKLPEGVPVIEIRPRIEK